MLSIALSSRLFFNYWVVFAIFNQLFVIADDTAKTKQLTLCVQQSEDQRSLIFVSTLDGKVSALDAANNGQKQWTLDFNNGPMLSSNIHSRELNDNGQWVRLIPSLNGGLYKFDGENLETVPITTDQLLHSSYRYSNDLVFSGAKEVYSYGVHTSTGRILYECDVTGCRNNTHNKGCLEQEVLVIKRLQQTVRAVEARTGIERWNFSVGQHDLVLVPPTETHCPPKPTLLDVQIKAVIPEGQIWAVNESDSTHILWQYKFDSPIVSIWRENANKDSTDQDLEEINLFNSSQWDWELKEYSTASPSLYIGMHQRQLYVQENIKLKNSLHLSLRHVQTAIYPWQPHPALGTAIKNTLTNKNDCEVSAAINEVQCTTALSVLYNSEYVNGNGFFLYSVNEITTEQISNEIASDVAKPNLTLMKSNEFPHMGLSSILYGWKVILVISIVLFLQILWPARYFERNIQDGLIAPIRIETISPAAEVKSNDTVHNESNSDFKSRFLIDFVLVDCLGKGGYGVVFEVKNRVDHRSYAIKRITLPVNKDSRERVMREARALAKLEHRNIVRYFNSWLECPPCGWEEEHDKKWANKLSSSVYSSQFTEANVNDSVCISLPQTDSPSAERPSKLYKSNNIITTNDSVVLYEFSSEKQHDDNTHHAAKNFYENYIVDNTEITNDDSVVFEVSSEKKQHDDTIYIGDSTNSSDASPLTKHPPSDIGNSSNSESIVFEGSDNNITEQITGSHVVEEINYNSTEAKENRNLRKAGLVLDLITKIDNHKSEKAFLYIQMELCQRLSLKEWLKQDSSVRDPSRVLSIFQQIVDAVEYIHLEGLIHRDLKPSNIFFAFDNSIKVGDFGLVTGITTESYDGTRTPETEDEIATLDSIHTACVGTHLYMSPEQANGQTYNYKVDIYSLGIIYFELLMPFSTEMERAIVLSDLRKSIFPDNFAEQHAAEYELLKIMLHEDPTRRPTTFGIKARLPLLNCQAAKLNVDKDITRHFELPRRIRHSSISNNNNVSFES